MIIDDEDEPTASIETVSRYTKADRATFDVRLRRMKQSVMEALYLKAKKAYYNDVPIMEDAQFDHLEDVLKERFPKSKLLKMVGAPVSGAKVKLPFPMSSLAKEKGDTIDRWLAKNPGPYILSDKEDGNSLQIVGTKQGNKLYSRGRSTKGSGGDSWGKDLSHLAASLNLPKLAVGQALRAEIVISPANFKKWSKEFQNERNIIGGFSTRKEVHPSIKDVDIVVYSQMNPPEKPSKYLPALKAKGWNVVPYKIVKSIDAEKLSAFYAERKKKSKWKIDGIVIAQDKAVKPSTDDPAHMRAFKENSDEEVAQTTVIGIEWNVSRHGLVVPTVLIKPVRLAGVTVNRATGWNAKRLLGMGIGKGAVIKIVRSGEVIPHIVGVVKKAPKPDKPPMKTEWDEHGTNLRIIDGSDIQKVKSLVHFFSTIGVDGLKIGIAQRLYNEGYRTPVKIIKATEAKLSAAVGSTAIGKKLYTNIRKALQTVDHTRLIDASGLFGTGIGTRRAAAILKAFSYERLKKMSPRIMANKISQLQGFTDKTATPFAQAFSKYAAFVDSLGIKVAGVKKIKATGTAMKDQQVVFTGVRDKALEEWIVKNGGSIGSGVSKSTSILIAKNPDESSLKLNKARDLGVKILSLERFKAKYKA